MKMKDYISGSFLFILSAILFFQARGLTIWEETGPSEGFFPLTLSIILGFLSILIIVQAWLRAGKSKEIFKVLGPERKKFFLYLASFLTFGLIFRKVGFSLTLLGFFVFTLRIIEKKSWKLTLTVMIISIILSYALFNILLSVPLPEGFLSSVIQRIKQI